MSGSVADIDKSGRNGAAAIPAAYPYLSGKQVSGSALSFPVSSVDLSYREHLSFVTYSALSMSSLPSQ